MLIDEEGDSIERLMSRWNAATQQWFGARKVLEALMDKDTDMGARLVAAEAVLALRNEMDRAKSVYQARANGKAVRHG
jgi:hypothetical protein